MKKITIIFFISFIFSVPLATILLPDKQISYIENKVLEQMPKLSIDDILSKQFMEDFDTYTTDQFPLRSKFIKLKNYYSYLLGNREFRNIYISKSNKLLEKFIFNKAVIDKNIDNISKTANHIKNNYGIKSKLMIIPTSTAFYEDELYNYMITDNQLNAINYINDSFINKSSSSSFYSPYKVLYENKDKYIFFNTDHHWTQLGACLAYEDMYKIKVLDDPVAVSNSFYGTYYSKSILDFITPDTIYAYTAFNNYKLTMDFNYTYNYLYDNSKLSTKNKYQYFLHGDPAIGYIEGNEKSTKEILIFKDSFAHNFMPFLTSNYSKIHFIDTRYYNGSINDYLSKNTNIDEILFIHNIANFNSNILYE